MYTLEIRLYRPDGMFDWKPVGRSFLTFNAAWYAARKLTRFRCRIVGMGSYVEV